MASKYELWVKLNEMLARVANLAHQRIKVVADCGAVYLLLDGESIGPSTREYYVELLGAEPNWVWIMSSIMDQILKPIEQAGMINCYRQALEEFYQFGTAVFPDDFKERWNDIIQFYYDYAGASPEEKGAKIERKIQRFHNENEERRRYYVKCHKEHQAVQE